MANARGLLPKPRQDELTDDLRLTRVILPLSLPGVAVTIILGFMFSWNAFNYPLMLAGRQTFPVTALVHGA